MKVTVCFGSIRVVVPCSQEEFLVRDLISKSITRYKKATAKSSESWVTVHNVRQLDGGILDPDDRVRDVADDREQLLAVFEEAPQPHQGGDGTSASDDSENASPPVVFKGADHKFSPFCRNDIEVTGECLSNAPPPLHVRRGSEPALNRLSPIPPSIEPPDPSKRWSAAPIIDDPQSSTPVKQEDMSSSYICYPPGEERGEGSGEEKNPSPSSSASSHHSATTAALSRFSRDGNRCSVQILSDNPSMTKWAEAADKVISMGEARRREPLGGASTPQHSRNPSLEDRSRPQSRISYDISSMHVVLSNDNTPLGIHVIPSTDRSGRDRGLLVEGVEARGRVARDGRIKVHDVIVEINDKSLTNVTFHQAQEIFKDAMRAPELRLLVTKSRERLRGDSLPASMQHNNYQYTPRGQSSSPPRPSQAPPSVRAQHGLLQSNTRRIGKRLNVNLVKGAHGLGFSITTRDNQAGGEAPIYIKNILPKGAAIEEGSLKIGDRLLEVNNVSVTGLHQTQVAALLRQITVGGLAALVVSRQENTFSNNTPNTSSLDRKFKQNNDILESSTNPYIGAHQQYGHSPNLPRKLVSSLFQDYCNVQQPPEKAAEDSLMFPWKQREILTFDIPVHDSERAGLGVSVKGKTSSGPNGNVDLGIFVKNVIHGGAASRDGRLRQNDQLVNINGMSLLGKANSSAMITLRTAMHQEGPNPGMITLTVARRVDSSGGRSGRESVNSLGAISTGGEILGGPYNPTGTTPTPEHSGTSDTSDNTVIFNAQKMAEMDRNMDGIGEMSSLHNPMMHSVGNNAQHSLRNESYYKATHDTWNNSQLHNLIAEQERMRGVAPPPNSYGSSHPPSFNSPTVNLPSQDTVMISDEYNSALLSRNAPPPAHVPADSPEGGGASEHPGSRGEAYVSQTSLEDSGAGFSRDQFGRQSMSEKRHATLDAKNTDTYQRNKKAREEREKQKQELLHTASQEGGAAGNNREADVGPGLGLRKSSSLESLQTMVQEMCFEEGGAKSNLRGSRGRGCNDSFRAAVDRSYEAPLATLHHQMETQEESESSGSGFGRGNSRQSSVNSGVDNAGRKGARKNKGLLKGLGSMFRFGKHRKSIDRIDDDLESLDPVKREEEHERLRDQYKRIAEKISKAHASTGGDGEPKTPEEEALMTRSERMHHLRAEHQRRHAQRNGTYPTDGTEGDFDNRMEPIPAEPKAEISHLRSQSHDMYSQGRGGARTPVGADPHKFSHYMNYEQIQMYLRKSQEQDRLKKLASQQYQDFRDKQSSREQREYQSQRSAPQKSAHLRPVSNYFEYESVQAMMSHAKDLSRSKTPALTGGAEPPQHKHHLPAQSLGRAAGMAKGMIGQPGGARIRNQTSIFPIQGGREGLFAAHGFHPASQFHTPNPHQSLPPAPLTVPGSKV